MYVAESSCFPDSCFERALLCAYFIAFIVLHSVYSLHVIHFFLMEHFRMENTLQLTITASGVNSKPIVLDFNSVTLDTKNAYLQESLRQN